MRAEGGDGLFGAASTTPEMSAAVSDAAWLKALLRFESELAAAEAKSNLIPASSAEAIATACLRTNLDAEAVGREAIASASPVLPVLTALRARLSEVDAVHLHHGATSQDALDTAAMLVAKDGLDILLREMAALASACALLAERHSADVITGRTLMRRGRPTTFGRKAAGWLIAVLESRSGLRRVRERRLAVQLGGAAGSLDVLGPLGLKVSAELSRRLGLVEPELPWHADRTRIGELAAALAIAGGAAAKIALDLILLSQDEVGEVELGRTGASSAMPHKRNPASAVEARAANSRLLGQVTVLLGGLAGEHERAAGAWQAEWPTLSEAFRLAAGVVARTRDSLEDLKVDVERMRMNAGQAVAPTAAVEMVRKALDLYRREEL